MTAAPRRPAPAGVGIFVPSLAGGGAERAMLNLARGMHELGHRVDLVVGTAKGRYRDEIIGGIDLIDLGVHRVLWALPGLIRYLRERRPAYLYAAMDHANVVALAARRLANVPTRIIVSIRCMLSQPAGGNSSLSSRVVLKLARAYYPSAHGIVAVSAGVADDATAILGLDRRRITVLDNPVLTPELHEQAMMPLDHPWFQPGSSTPVLLACGRLVPVKGFTSLIEAFADLRSRREARLVILGDGPDRSALLARAEALGVAQSLWLPGFDVNPFRYMARARLFVLSSVCEGSPNVLVQALACGCAVVSTDCPGGVREILDGVPGTALVPVGDTAALARAMEALLAENAGRLSPRLLSRFDYRTAAAGYLAVATA
jgi:glycosyltransferase involved in cell wall biosynthesis